jgi:aspartyl-tRNA(Asn)/glutamyl-tRNA(Gln) amidotransferase subunit A
MNRKKDIMDLHTLTIHEAHERLKNRDFSARELTQALLKRIEEVEPKVKAYISVTPEKASRRRISRQDDRRKNNAADRYVAIKDVLALRSTTCGSNPQFVPVTMPQWC